MITRPRPATASAGRPATCGRRPDRRRRARRTPAAGPATASAP